MANVKGIPGPQGPQGPKGERGVQGPQGPVGPAGPRGAAGPSGATGARGLQGSTGPAGAAGAAGAPGAAGVGFPTPFPSYQAEVAFKAGTTRWRQTAEVEAVFDGSTAQVAVVWESFETRDFLVYCGAPITDEEEAIVVLVVQSSITASGCTLQAVAPFVGRVPLQIKEVLS